MEGPRPTQQTQWESRAHEHTLGQLVMTAHRRQSHNEKTHIQSPDCEIAWKKTIRARFPTEKLDILKG